MTHEHEAAKYFGQLKEITDILGVGPEKNQFRRLASSSGNPVYQATIGARTLEVECSIETREDKRWLKLNLGAGFDLPSFSDLAYVRKAFVGYEREAFVFFPKGAATPVASFKLALWVPLEAVVSPDVCTLLRGGQ